MCYCCFGCSTTSEVHVEKIKAKIRTPFQIPGHRQTFLLLLIKNPRACHGLHTTHQHPFRGKNVFQDDKPWTSRDIDERIPKRFSPVLPEDLAQLPKVLRASEDFSETPIIGHRLRHEHKKCEHSHELMLVPSGDGYVPKLHPETEVSCPPATLVLVTIADET
jgi:hypothetical protein